MKKQLLIFLTTILIIHTSNAQKTSNDVKVIGTTINYETGTLILTAINSTLTTLNLAGINPKWQPQYVQGVAIATGVCQLGYGIWQTRSDFATLNLVNITAGTATIITNGILLYNTLNPGKKLFSWNLYSAPIPNKMNKLEFGVKLVKKF